jgi:hypothetical protein
MVVRALRQVRLKGMRESCDHTGEGWVDGAAGLVDTRKKEILYIRQD